MKKLFIFLLMLSCCFGCKKNKHVIKACVYHWKTSFQNIKTEEEFLRDNHVQTIYLHLFDVVWDNALSVAKPNAVLVLKQGLDTSVHYIPVVFISNEVVKKADSTAIQTLAKDICVKTKALTSSYGLSTIKEIQLDCDWSESSRDKYFYLLQLVKENDFLKDKILSCTIRLHQIKYRDKTGIPPVDKGLLMCYNMGNLVHYQTGNSILENEELNKYLYHQKVYELPLDLALPIFAWGVLFHDQKYVCLINELTDKDLEHNANFVKLKEHYYKAIADNVLFGISIKVGEEIRIEDCAAEEILEAKNTCLSIIKNQEINLVLYHLDERLISKYSKHFYKQVYQ